MIALQSTIRAFHLLSPQAVLLLLLVLSGMTSAVLVGMGLVAYWRRRSRSYLLIVFALAVHICKVAVGGFSLVGVMPTQFHHLVEHGLDLVMAASLIAAVYYARTPVRNRSDDVGQNN